jgi:hypothetical protein
LDKIGEDLEWEYQNITAEQTIYTHTQKTENNTTFIEEYEGVIE